MKCSRGTHFHCASRSNRSLIKSYVSCGTRETSIVRWEQLPEEAVGAIALYRALRRNFVTVNESGHCSPFGMSGPAIRLGWSVVGRFEFLASLVSSSDAGGAAYLAYTARQPQRVPFQEGASKTPPRSTFLSRRDPASSLPHRQEFQLAAARIRRLRTRDARKVRTLRGGGRKRGWFQLRLFSIPNRRGRGESHR